MNHWGIQMNGPEGCENGFREPLATFQAAYLFHETHPKAKALGFALWGLQPQTHASQG